MTTLDPRLASYLRLPKKSVAATPKASDPGRFRHLHPAAQATEPARTHGASDQKNVAIKMLRVAAQVRGETFDDRNWITAPEQRTRRVSGADILQAARRAGVVR